MIGAAVSDLHLGLRQFAALTDGRNAREVDVERAWAAAVDLIVEDRPALVTVAGDIFHTVRPSMHAVRAWQLGVRRIVGELPETHVVAILGNHETPRTLEALTPVIVVEGEPRVHVVTRPKRLRLRAGGELISIACFPFVTLAAEESYQLAPDSDVDVNALVVHAAVRGGENGDALPRFYAGKDALDIAREAERWHVVHAGDFHDFTRLHPSALAFYSGAIERTTSNIWAEHPEKGVVTYDTLTRRMQLRAIPIRPVYDYALSNLEPGAPSAEAVNGALVTLSLLDVLEGAVVRLCVDDFPREERDMINWGTVRHLKSCALHFQLDLRLAEREHVRLHDRRDGRGCTLEEEAAAFFGDEPENVRDLAVGYLREESAA